MKTVSKKLLSILLVAVLLVSAVPFSAFATVPHESSHTMVDGNNATAHWKQCDQSDCDQYGIPVSAEAHSGDPCSVCGYTAPAITHDATHIVSVWNITATGHSRTCQTVGCEKYGMEVEAGGHSYSAGACVVCGYVHPEADHVETPIAGTGSAASCYKAGHEASTECSICHKVMHTGIEIAATGAHVYGTDGHCTTEGCPAFQAGADCTLMLSTASDVNGVTVSDATVAGAFALAITIKENTPITNLPDPVRPGYTFGGWFLASTGTQIYLGQTYTFGSLEIAVPKWTEQTYSLTVRRTLNGDLSTAKTIYTVNVPAGTALLNFLNTNVTSYVNADLATNPGFAWADGLWRDFSGMMPITSQLDKMDQARVIYVNYTSTGHVLYFNANGGTVNPTQKGVTYGQPVGTLPTPVKSGSVFQGWKDSTGKIYTAATIYDVAGDTSLEAVWNDEALVILYIYLNGNTSQVNRMVSMDKFVVGNNISRADVVSTVCQYYTSISGYSLQVAGLFDDNTWPAYCGNMYLGGVDNIQVTSGHLTKIYVMVRNANATNGTTSYTGGYTYGYDSGIMTIGTGSYNYVYNYGNGTYSINGITYYGTNPKTGDSSNIEVAVTVLVMSASALAVLIYLNFRKRRAC